jgi:hypothetical protein
MRIKEIPPSSTGPERLRMLRKFFNEEMDYKKAPDGKGALSMPIKKLPKENSRQAAEHKPTGNSTFKASTTTPID